GSMAIARSLGRRGIPVWFFNSGNPITRFSRYVRRSLALPRCPEEQIEYLLESATRNRLQGWTLFPGGDSEAELLARYRSPLAESFRMITPPWNVMRWASDKRLTYQLAARLGIAHPWTSYPRGRDEVAATEGRLPMILKATENEPRHAVQEG